MDQFWNFLDGGVARNSAFTPESVLLSLLLAFVLGQLLAWIYFFTHSGLSYSRSFVQSLVLIAIIVSLVMAVIGNSIITAFGLMGALAIVRFRNVIKDTRDVVFLFGSLVIGMATGSQRYAIAIIGTFAIGLVVLYLQFTGFGSRHACNAFLRFTLTGPIGPEHPVPGILKRFCSQFSLISMQNNSVIDAAEHAYQLMIRDCSRNEEMLSQLGRLTGISDISLTMQEELLEV